MSDSGAAAVRLERQGERGRYVLALPDGTEAEMTFRTGPDGVLAVDHTFVPPRHRGQGIAARLVQQAVADARDQGTRILPLCPFVAAEFRRHPEWTDVMGGQRR